MRLLLIRHGRTAWNQEQRMQGSGSDIELDSTGREQAGKIAQALQKVPLMAVYSSPLKRAVATAQAIASPHGLEVRTEPGLEEIDAGIIDGMPLSELREKHGGFWHDWLFAGGVPRWPGGESLQDLQDRAMKATRGILERHSTGTVVVVGHTFVVTALILALLGLELALFRNLRVEIASITTLELNQGKARLISFDDTCHLMD